MPADSGRCYIIYNDIY